MFCFCAAFIFACLRFRSEVVRIMSGDHALAPGADVESHIALVQDPASQAIFRYLVAENASMRQSQLSMSDQYQHMISILQDVAGNVVSTKADVADILVRFQTPPVPAFVNADSRDSSAASSAYSNKSDSDSGSVGPLGCPFCSHRHRTEKIHVQHIVRLAGRVANRLKNAAVILSVLDLPFFQSFLQWQMQG